MRIIDIGAAGLGLMVFGWNLPGDAVWLAITCEAYGQGLIMMFFGIIVGRAWER